MPLMSITLPSNVIVCFNSIIEVSKMNIIPKAMIKGMLKNFVKEQSESTKENFRQMDIFKT